MGGKRWHVRFNICISGRVFKTSEFVVFVHADTGVPEWPMPPEPQT
jgi:hypothetical protein